MTPIDFAIISLIALLGATVILVTLGRHSRKPTVVTAGQSMTHVVLLFRGDLLIDATPDALDLLGPDLQGLEDTLDVLATEFPKLPEVLAVKSGWNGTMASPVHPSLMLKVSNQYDAMRFDLSGDINALRHHGRKQAAQAKSLFHDIQTFSPQLVWQENQSRKVTWANAAYQDLAAQIRANSPFAFDPEVGEGAQTCQRISLSDDDTRWFDITTVAQGDGFLHFAVDATPLVRADHDRRSFVQTLGKTFADLSIGLAIFDKDRQLAMFNPALLEMTKLPVTFLSARPTIDTVLDHLRELRMMPEPADYASWREKFTAVEAGAKSGTYTENWALPDGQTYRVTGRPHPDGAFAILFEDITAEVSLTRRFRSDIETGQAVLDTLPDAIAVFSRSGTMVMSNRSYSNLWSTQAELFLDHRDIKTEIEAWQDNCIASPIWDEMQDFLHLLENRKPWTQDAMLIDGRHIQCHAVPIAGGMTMVRFVVAPLSRPVIHKLTQVDTALLANKA